MKSPGAEPFETQPEPSIKVLHVQEALIFLHLMKTGGTSLFRLLKPHYPRQHTFHYGSKPGRTLHDFEQLPPDNRDQLKFIHGHLAFGFHHRLNQPCRYITMLRDPISRVISLYYFLYHNPQRYIPEHQRCETLHDFLELNYLDADNYQTRQIAGPLSEQFGFGKCNTTLLNVAKANLAECLSVGITERFDESLLVLRHQLGLNQILYAPFNQNQSKPKRETIDNQDLERIRTCNQFDIELYQFANKLLDQSVNTLGDSFKAEYHLFQFANDQYRSTTSEVASVKKKIRKTRKTIKRVRQRRQQFKQKKESIQEKISSISQSRFFQLVQRFSRFWHTTAKFKK